MRSSLPTLALLAGGLATRMRPATKIIPKSLLPIAGEPFLAHQLRFLACQGVEDVVLCCGHLGEQIQSFAGDGSAFGCRVRYSFDGERLLGTGGALRQALPLLGDHFFVLYGDSYLSIDFAAVYHAFLRAEMPGLMTVFRNHGRWDSSNVVFREGRVTKYDKRTLSPDMQYIDYGLGVLSAGCFALHGHGEKFDLAEIYSSLADKGQLAGFEARERFYEIGSPAGLSEANHFLSGVPV